MNSCNEEGEEEEELYLKEWQQEFNNEQDEYDYSEEDEEPIKSSDAKRFEDQSPQTTYHFDENYSGEEELLKRVVLTRNGLVPKGTNLFFGDHISVYCKATASKYEFVEPQLVCCESNIVKMILEAFLGIESDLFSKTQDMNSNSGDKMPSEDYHLKRRNNYFRLTYVAYRLSLKNVRPQALTAMLQWFAAQASAASICRNFIHEAMTSSAGTTRNSQYDKDHHPLYNNLLGSLATTLMSSMNEMDREIIALEKRLHSSSTNPAHRPPTLLFVYVHMRKWGSLLQNGVNLAYALSKVQKRNENHLSVTSTVTSRGPYLSYPSAEPHKIGLSVCSLIKIYVSILSALEQHTPGKTAEALLRKRMSTHSLDVNLVAGHCNPFLTYSMNAATSCLRVYIEYAFHSVWREAGGAGAGDNEKYPGVAADRVKMYSTLDPVGNLLYVSIVCCICAII